MYDELVSNVFDRQMSKLLASKQTYMAPVPVSLL